jgi:hypothetical protein
MSFSLGLAWSLVLFSFVYGCVLVLRVEECSFESSERKKLMNTTIERCRDILLHPQRTWSVIATEPGGLKEAFYPYAFVMGLIPVVVMIIVGAGMNLVKMLNFALISYVGSLVFMLLVGKVMEWLAPLFGARKSWVLSCRVLIYAGTPICVAALLGLIPILGTLLSLLALPWALVLLYLGMGRVLETQGARQLLFTLTTLLIFAIIPIIAFTLMPHPIHSATPVTATVMDPQTATMLASMKAESGQGTDADMQRAADAQVQQLIANGQIKPDQADNKRDEILKGMQAIKVEMEKATAEANQSH